MIKASFERAAMIGAAIYSASPAMASVTTAERGSFGIPFGGEQVESVSRRSGRVREGLSTEPGLQFYSGNFLAGELVGKGGHVYRMGDGIALEPQPFPDTSNQPTFGSARVEPGKPYHHRMVYRVYTDR